MHHKGEIAVTVKGRRVERQRGVGGTQLRRVDRRGPTLHDTPAKRLTPGRLEVSARRIVHRLVPAPEGYFPKPLDREAFIEKVNEVLAD